jgi:transcriptional regulator with XRE-family HTH domain
MHPTDAHVGQRVRMRRLMLGMSQSNVADALGVTFQQLQKYEKGVNRISARRLQHIARIFQVPVTFFLKERRTSLARSLRKPMLLFSWRPCSEAQQKA